LHVIWSGGPTPRRADSPSALGIGAIFNQETIPAIATFGEAEEAVMIPAETFRNWINRYAVWRNIINLLSQRLSSLMMVID